MGGRGGIRGHYISKGGTDVRAGRTVGTAGHKWEVGWPEGRDGGQADGDGEKHFRW